MVTSPILMHQCVLHGHKNISPKNQNFLITNKANRERLTVIVFIFFDNDFSYPVFSSFARVFIAAMYPYGRQPTYGTATSVPSINPYGVPQPYATAPSYPHPQSVAPSFLPPGSNPSSFYQYTKGPAPTAPAQYPNAPVEAIGEKCELVGFLMHRIPNPRAPQHRAPQPSSVHKDRVVHS